MIPAERPAGRPLGHGRPPEPFLRNGVYHCRFQIGGRAFHRSTGERIKAKARKVAFDLWMAERLRSQGLEPELPLGDLVRLWLQLEGPRKSLSHQASMERFGSQHLGGLALRRMSELGQQEVEDAWNSFMANHARTTAKQWLIHLNLLWNFAVRQRMVRGGYPWHIRQIKAQAKPKALLPTSVGADWFSALQRSCPDPGVVGVVALMLGMGLRFSEASGARWEWADWDAMTYTPGKTKGFEAWARPIPSWVMMALPERQAEGPMLLNRRGRPVNVKAVQAAMDAASMAVGIRRLTPHCLRHTYGTQLADAGVPEKAIQQAFGHKDSRTTRGYLHVDQSQVLKGQVIAQQRMGIGRAKPVRDQDPGQGRP